MKFKLAQLREDSARSRALTSQRKAGYFVFVRFEWTVEPAGTSRPAVATAATSRPDFKLKNVTENASTNFFASNILLLDGIVQTVFQRVPNSSVIKTTIFECLTGKLKDKKATCWTAVQKCKSQCGAGIGKSWVCFECYVVREWARDPASCRLWFAR